MRVPTRHWRPKKASVSLPAVVPVGVTSVLGRKGTYKVWRNQRNQRAGNDLHQKKKRYLSREDQGSVAKFPALPFHGKQRHANRSQEVSATAVAI